jgi:membrane protein YqaA with SNARE-associated domain
LFGGCFLAATVIPFASEAIFLAALKLSGQPAALLVLVAGLGNTAGGLTGYFLGKLARWEWLEKYFRLRREKVMAYEKTTKQYGAWLALLCWVPLVGDLLCVVLGFFRAKLLPVTILMFLGKTARYIAVALLAGLF